jgi:hypothetical protein
MFPIFPFISLDELGVYVGIVNALGLKSLFVVVLKTGFQDKFGW